MLHWKHNLKLTTTETNRLELDMLFLSLIYYTVGLSFVDWLWEMGKFKVSYIFVVYFIKSHPWRSWLLCKEHFLGNFEWPFWMIHRERCHSSLALALVLSFNNLYTSTTPQKLFHDLRVDSSHDVMHNYLSSSFWWFECHKKFCYCHRKQQ